MKRDIFDEIELEERRVFKRVEPPTREELEKKIADAKLIERIKKEVLASIKIPEAPKPEIKIVEKVVEKPAPVEIHVEDPRIAKMCDEIEKLKSVIEDQNKKLDEVKDAGPVFIPAAPVIPNWSGSAGKILSNNGDQLQWVSSISLSSEVYSASNVTTTRTIDANDTSIDELADVLSTLIVDLQNAGVIQ